MGNVYEDVICERLAQDAEFGGAAADDKLTVGAWVEKVTKHVERAYADDAQGDVGTARYDFVRVAALAIAAAQALDRRLASAP